MVFHVLNRGNARREIFEDGADYDAWVEQPQTPGELEALRTCVVRGRPQKKPTPA